MEGTGARFARSAPRPGSLVNWRAVVAKGPPAHSTEPAYPCCFPALQLRDQRERIARDVEKVLDEPRDEGTHAIAGHVPISDPPTPPGPVTTPPGSSTTGAVSHADPISQQPPSGGNEQGNGVRRDVRRTRGRNKGRHEGFGAHGTCVPSAPTTAPTTRERRSPGE
jgi:hypothetical protein